MTSLIGQYATPFFALGLLVVFVYAWRRFDEPSFSSDEALPSTTEPLRYLFLRREYRRARFTYVVASLLLYCALVWPGPTVVPALGVVGMKDFPTEAWALLVALILVGLIPNSNLTWLTTVEAHLRRLVHSRFLVPDGTMRMIGSLQDAPYEPPASQLNAVPSAQREALQRDLKAPTSSLRYRWARATMLMESFRQLGAGAVHPLHRATFEPFNKDFESIQERYRTLAQDVAALGDLDAGTPQHEKTTRAVDALLRRIYAYLNWGLRYSADSEREVSQTLEDIGFTVPEIGDQRLFDIVFPATLLVAGITMGFWLIVDGLGNLTSGKGPTLATSVVTALSSGMSASLMYGGAVVIALRRRASQIERMEWRGTTPKCLVPIAVSAGLTTWFVITATTALWEMGQTAESLASGVRAARAYLSGIPASDPGAVPWTFLPIRIATAAPWLLAGAVASVLLAILVSGSVRKSETSRRIREALILGGGLGLAVSCAQLIQTALAFNLLGRTPAWEFVPVVGLAGFACGAAIGFAVPHAFRASLIEPFDPETARTLCDLLREAERVHGTRDAAETWAFEPHRRLRGITPAEAVQTQAFSTRARALLDDIAFANGPAARDEREPAPMPVVIEGGRKRG
jgi:hypothetical protein